MFHWAALEQDDALEGQGLEVFQGEGDWGVSTLKVNPVTGSPFYRLFRKESEAIHYARVRAFRTGYVRSEKGRVMYVVRFDDAHPKDTSPGDVRYRVLRGQRGLRQEAGYPHGGSRQEQILVFENGGPLPNGKIRWKLSKGLTVDVVDLEEEYEKARRARGLQPVRREELVPRNTIIEPRPLRTGTGGPRLHPSDDELASRHKARDARAAEQQTELDQQTREYLAQRAAVGDRAEDALADRIAALTRLKEHLESQYLRDKRPGVLERIEHLEGQILALARR